MHTEPIAGGAPPSGTVRGLGVCDALSVHLQPAQVPWLIDELDHRRGPIEEELRRLRETHMRGGNDAPADEIEEREYELRLLQAMRAQLDGGGHNGLTGFVGPSGMVGEIARDTMRFVVQRLSELVHSGSVIDPDELARLHVTADAARAWVQTFLDCRAVETFNFDPEADPAAPW
jgi:hypothetical protein